jgi:tetratricopeptide (TPR) repeat protein
MRTKLLIRGLVVGAFAVMVASMAAPAAAQTSFQGKVVDEKGQPVADAEVSCESIANPGVTLKAKTNAKGVWERGGLDRGQWNVKVVKGDLSGAALDVTVKRDIINEVPTIVLKPGGAAAVVKAADPKAAAEANARAKKQMELKGKFEEADAAIKIGNYDEALTKLTAIAGELEKCAPCSVKLGEAYLRKGDLENAEKFFLQSIEYDPGTVDAYKALATIYNGQKKFEEAAAMGAKANDLMAATGGGDAATSFNQGAILWNAGKAADAQKQFERAIQLDPKMADAYYYLAVTILAQGKMAEAKKPLQDYLALAPTGAHAKDAKDMLAQIK